jgi:hypothetical protein
MSRSFDVPGLHHAPEAELVPYFTRDATTSYTSLHLFLTLSFLYKLCVQALRYSASEPLSHTISP